MLLVATYAKAIDPLAFAEQIAAEGIGFGHPFRVALVGLAIEAGLGLALLLGVRRLLVLWPASALVAFFLFLTGRTWWRAAHGILPAVGSCGCFGNLVERTPAEAFAGDLVMLVPPLVLAWIGRSRGGRPPIVRLGLAAVFAVAVAVFGAKAPNLPLDDLATRLRVGTEVEAMCAGAEPEICLADLVSGLETGEHWIVLADLESLEGMIDPLNARVWEFGEQGLHVLTPAPTSEVETFRFLNGPAFDLHGDAPAALIRPLYRRLPRSFRVEDGRVAETASGWPPWLQVGPSGSPGLTSDGPLR